MHSIRAARSFFSSLRSCSERSVLSISVSGSSSASSSSGASPGAPALLLGPLTPLAAVPARPPAADGVCSRALSALGLRPRFRLFWAAPPGWLPLTSDAPSTSTDGERAVMGVPTSSGGKDV